MSLAFNSLMDELHEVFDQVPALNAFCRIPQDLAASPIERFAHPVEKLFEKDALADTPFPALRDALVMAGSSAQWRETYKGTCVSNDFMQRFGCYCIVGEGGPWVSESWAAYMVYMPPFLDYPRHEHPAEELYFVVAGHAEFAQGAAAYSRVSAGETVFHPSGVPHATRTLASSFLALVFWRSHFETPPVWSADAVFA